MINWRNHVVVFMISTPHYCIRSLRSPSYCFCTKSIKKMCWLLWFLCR